MDGSRIEVKQEPVSETTLSVVSSRGRGGSGRARARGRGARVASRGGGSLPSARQRLSELKLTEDRRAPERKEGSGMSLADLGKALNSAFPSSSTPVNPFQRIPISTLGYQQLSLATYRELISIDRGGEADLSEAEFLVMMGHALLIRIIKVQSEVMQLEIDTTSYMSSFPKNMTVPAPVATALSVLGVMRDAGTTGVPSILLPNGRTDDCKSGFYPTTALNADEKTVENGFLSMFPFGLYAYKMSNYISEDVEMGIRDEAKANEAAKKRKVADKKYDEFASRWATYSLYGSVRDTRARLLPLKNVTSEFREDTSLKARTKYSPTMVESYIHFCSRFEGKYNFSPLPSDIKGSRVLSGFTTPVDGDPTISADEHEAFSNLALDENEQQAVRLFRWREDIVRGSNCFFADGRDKHYIVSEGPPNFRSPGLYRLSRVDSHKALCAMYVSYFKLKK